MQRPVNEMIIEKHSSDLGYLFIYHLARVALTAALVYVANLLLDRLATLWGRRRKRGPEDVGGLNRRQRCRERAMKQRRR